MFLSYKYLMFISIFLESFNPHASHWLSRSFRTIYCGTSSTKICFPVWHKDFHVSFSPWFSLSWPTHSTHTAEYEHTKLIPFLSFQVLFSKIILRDWDPLRDCFTMFIKFLVVVDRIGEKMTHLPPSSFVYNLFSEVCCIYVVGRIVSCWNNLYSQTLPSE